MENVGKAAKDSRQKKTSDILKNSAKWTDNR